MEKIVPDLLSWTTNRLHFCFEPTGMVLSSGTGFIFEYSGKNYLITNYHSVSGRDPITGKCLSSTHVAPDMISTMFRLKDHPINSRRESIRLYHDDCMLKPAWYIHPEYGQNVDVIALPIPQEITDYYKLVAINSIKFDLECKEEIADDAFVIGYPFSGATYLQLPIWMRASIASEPAVDIDRLPKLFVETATRLGLSGSPVIMQRVGIHDMKNGALTGSEVFGRIRNFIGVYSDNIGCDELRSRLGVVWKEKVISEIIESKVFGKVAVRM